MEDKTKALTQHFTLGKLFVYVLPTILAVLLASLYTIVDGVFVSNFGGTTAFAAINQVSPIFMIVAAIWSARSWARAIPSGRTVCSPFSDMS